METKKREKHICLIDYIRKLSFSVALVSREEVQNCATAHVKDATGGRSIKIAFTIINARYLMNKPTIISSEWDLVNQLLPADEGVFSRVYERCKGNRLTIERKMENNYRLTA